jgi:SPX domain protein involved in polyphosphate accumulation
MTDKKQRHVSNEVGKLEARIEKASSQTKRDYMKALRTVENLKNKMNELERNISQKKRAETDQDLNALDLTLKRLNRFTDSQILGSKKAWREYRKLEGDCKLHGLKPVQLDDLLIACKKTEELAADLLCYSLARFKLARQ